MFTNAVREFGPDRECTAEHAVAPECTRVPSRFRQTKRLDSGGARESERRLDSERNGAPGPADDWEPCRMLPLPPRCRLPPRPAVPPTNGAAPRTPRFTRSSAITCARSMPPSRKATRLLRSRRSCARSWRVISTAACSAEGSHTSRAPGARSGAWSPSRAKVADSVRAAWADAWRRLPPTSWTTCSRLCLCASGC